MRFEGATGRSTSSWAIFRTSPVGWMSIQYGFARTWTSSPRTSPYKNSLPDIKLPNVLILSSRTNVRDLTFEAKTIQISLCDPSPGEGFLALLGMTTLYFGTIATKSRTGFCSAMENALLFARLNQKALDEPPSRLSAR